MQCLRWATADELRVGLALKTTLRTDEASNGSDLVMKVLRGVIDIERRMQVKSYRSAPNRACWVNYVHDDLTKEDWDDIMKQRWAEVAAGDPIDVVFGFKIEATPDEQEIMESVIRVFRSCLVGKNQLRDWKIIFAFAKGKSIREVARQFNIKRTRAQECRDMQCAAIWTQIKRLMPKDSEFRAAA